MPTHTKVSTLLPAAVPWGASFVRMAGRHAGAGPASTLRRSHDDR
jgi:hypothetical protein